MKRTAFLGGTAATALAGCGGHAASSIPGISSADSSSQSHARSNTAASKNVRLVPATPDPIAQHVLDNPIIGEARRYNGTTIPPKWLLAQGQVLNISAYPGLYAVLGTIAGGDGKTTFMAPNAPGNWIIATQGALPASPKALALAGRVTDSLQGAIAAPVPMPTTVPKELAAERALALAAPSYGAGNPAPLTSDDRTRFGAAIASARDAAQAGLSSATRAELAAAIGDAVAGRSTIAQAASRIMRALTPSEAASVLGASDAMNASFEARGAMTHALPQLEAARFLIAVSMTPAQVKSALQYE